MVLKNLERCIPITNSVASQSKRCEREQVTLLLKVKTIEITESYESIHEEKIQRIFESKLAGKKERKTE